MQLLPNPKDNIETDALLAGVLASSTDCIKVLDEHGAILFMSEGGQRAMGVDDFETIRGCPWLSFWEKPGSRMAAAALEQALGGGKGQFQAQTKTMAGEDRWWDVTITPLHSGTSGPVRLLAVSRDVTLSRAAQDEITLKEKHLRYAMEAGRLGYWQLDIPTMALTVSDRCKANYGIGAETPFTYEKLLSVIYPEDLPAMQAAVQRCIETGEDYDMEYRVLLPDGQIGWVLARGQTERDAVGVATQMFGISLDITERKRAAERQTLLAFEVNHRMKNTLAVVQSIATQTLKNAKSLEEGREAFQQRLLAISQTQDILSEAGWENASLRSVVLAALRPYGITPRRFTLVGPELQVSAKCALALSLTLNELATNAQKHGSLAQSSGRVSIIWSVERSGRKSFEFTWRERGGPAAKEPSTSGFGSLLIKRALTAYMGGTGVHSFEPSGVVFRLSAPLVGVEAEQTIDDDCLSYNKLDGPGERFVAERLPDNLGA